MIDWAMKNFGVKKSVGIGLLLLGVAGIVVLNMRTLWMEKQDMAEITPPSVQETQGPVVTWGNGDGSKARQQVEVVDWSQVKMQQVVGGLDHAAFLSEAGEVWSLGHDTYGEMGGGTVAYGGLTKANLPEGVKVKKVAAGQYHTMALSEEGNVYSWGFNLSGQLGNGKNTQEFAPYLIQGLEKVVDIAAGYRLSVAVKEDGTVWAWGTSCDRSQIQDFDLFLANLGESLAQNGGYFDGVSGATELNQLNDCLGEEWVNISSTVPKKVEGLMKVKQASAGYGHILALDEEGKVWAWGCNKYGQVATGEAKNTELTKKPQVVELPGRVMQVVAGFRHSLVLLEDGSVYSWGHNNFGELGLGHAGDIYVPTKIETLDMVRWIGADHDVSWAVTEDGKLWGFGENQFGLLANSNEIAIGSPTEVFGLVDVRAVASGATWAVAIKN